MRFLESDQLEAGDLADKVAKVREAIERGDLCSPDVKKLTPGPYYRAKLDAANRLLLQFVSAEGGTACLALELIRQHRYDRSRYLRGAPVDEKLLESAAVEEQPESTPLRYLHPTRPTFIHLDKPISPDDAQEVVLQARMPLVVVGAAGSGKTALLLHKLRQAHGRVAYLTESRWLAESARSMYVAFDGAPEGQEVADFLSYQQLLESVRVPSGRPVTLRDFAGFFARHRSKVPFADAHGCFEELRGVLTADAGGPLTREAYLALGARQSMYEPSQREAVFELFERYREWLAVAGLYEPNIVAYQALAQVQPCYDCVVVDEVQDLSNVQLALVLRTLSQPGRFMLAGDAHQVVHPNFFSWSGVRSLFWGGLGPVREGEGVHLLACGYRNSGAVTRAAQRLLRLRELRFGSIDRESDTPVQTVGGEPGAVRVFRVGTAAVRELDERTRQSTRVAVVVLREEDKASARAVFRTPLIFSIHECKGLEYDTVILHRLVSTERRLFAELLEGVDTAAVVDDAPLAYARGRDKQDRSSERFKFHINALYVGLTRAVREVLLVEDDPQHALVQLLDAQEQTTAAAVRQERATSEEWQREAGRLEAQGKSEQAEAIRQQVLRYAPVPWKPLDRDGVAALAATTLVPGCVSNKSMERLMEFAGFHQERLLVVRMAEVTGRPWKWDDDLAWSVTLRHLQKYTSTRLRDVLDDVERYGPEHRLPMGITPLMAAAYAFNAPLCEALIKRGARRDGRDHAGLTPMHWLLRRRLVIGEKSPAMGAVWELVAPPSIDVEVDGRLLQLGRETGEYFVFAAMVARMSTCLYSTTYRLMGHSAAELYERIEYGLPSVLLREERQRRDYLSQVLARAEAQSKYRPARRLWIRERRGQYMPNPSLRLRVLQSDGTEAWQPIYEVLNAAWFDGLMGPTARGRLRDLPIPGPLGEGGDKAASEEE